MPNHQVKHDQHWDLRQNKPDQEHQNGEEYSKLATVAVAGVRKLAEPLDAGETRKYLELVWLLLADECGLALSD